ncbi:FliB domain-containing protein, partial [Cephalotus follicularis]
MSQCLVVPCLNTVCVAKPRSGKPKSGTKQNRNIVGFGADKKQPLWQCAEGCGACCKLAKGPAYPAPEEILNDPADIELYKSMTGPDGWCIHYEKVARKCSIYPDRPYFCRVEPDVFKSLYNIDKKKFNKEACSCCREAIKAIYGSQSKELDNFNHVIRSS